jgi:hypothetical protein
VSARNCFAHDAVALPDNAGFAHNIAALLGTAGASTTPIPLGLASLFEAWQARVLTPWPSA